MANLEKIRVGVMFGGRSGEHEVSLLSASSIISALDTKKFEVIPIGITRQGAWMVGADPQEMLPRPQATPDINAGRPTGTSGKLGLLGNPKHRGLILLEKTPTKEEVKLDVIFPVVHGTHGEDGTLQGLLELADLPYVGCGVLASAMGMDKTTAKKMFRDAGLPICPFIELLRKDWRKKPTQLITEIEKKFSYPVFVKPVNSGSSVGISKAHHRAELEKAIDLAARFDRKIMVESFVNGREIEVSVMGNDEPVASLPGEIIPSNEFYDYQAKYVDDKSALNIPASLSPDQTQEVRELAIKAFKALDCAGLARVDFFLDQETGKWILNEINTIPGFTQVSMYPKLWEASGVPYPELVAKLVDLALERYRDKEESLAAVA